MAATTATTAGLAGGAAAAGTAASTTAATAAGAAKAASAASKANAVFNNIGKGLGLASTAQGLVSPMTQDSPAPSNEPVFNPQNFLAKQWDWGKTNYGGQ